MEPNVDLFRPILFKYLSKNYIVYNHKTHISHKNGYGEPISYYADVIDELNKIFNIPKLYITNLFDLWLDYVGVDKDYANIYSSFQLTQELEANLVAEITREIDRAILNDLFNFSNEDINLNEELRREEFNNNTREDNT